MESGEQAAVRRHRRKVIAGAILVPVAVVQVLRLTCSIIWPSVNIRSHKALPIVFAASIIIGLIDIALTSYSGYYAARYTRWGVRASLWVGLAIGAIWVPTELICSTGTHGVDRFISQFRPAGWAFSGLMSILHASTLAVVGGLVALAQPKP
ncbi:MAG: hypothetical protein ABFD49_10285 [Armatimonadota bacterium]